MSDRPNNDLSVLKAPGSELMIGLVGAVGSDLDRVFDILKDHLNRLGYRSHSIRLIEGIHQISGIKTELVDSPLEERYRTRMNAGNELRKRLKRTDAFALLGAANIRAERNKITGSEQKAADKTAYVLRSLKTKQEIKTLRAIYGRAFICVGVFSRRDHRLQRLASLIADSHSSSKSQEFESNALSLIQRDEAEHDPFGQNLRDAFSQADFFVNGSDFSGLDAAMGRILESLFSHPFHTPSKDERGMFHAHAASMRSASLGRQVGAAIATPDGEIICLGCNEVPKAGGGAYWEDDDPDERDHMRGEDSNDRMKRKLLGDVLQRLNDKNWLAPEKGKLPLPEMVSQALLPPDKGGLGKVELMNVGEYGRSVHAEMAALLQAARVGIGVRGCTLFTTTFPCHNCTKHIIEAGITRVVYIEPYPKSLAAELHSDSIEIDKPGRGTRFVQFEAFVGIAPRAYLDLFSAAEIDRKNDENGKPMRFDSAAATPRLFEASWAYLSKELQVMNFLSEYLNKENLKPVTNKDPNNEYNSLAK